MRTALSLNIRGLRELWRKVLLGPGPLQQVHQGELSLEFQGHSKKTRHHSRTTESDSCFAKIPGVPGVHRSVTVWKAPL
jgi:hypothetical protein